MKILVTGNTPQQCGRGTQMKYGPVIDLFVRALRDAGVDVDHRIMEPEENLDEYDAVWLGISPINSMSARYMFAPLDTYRRCRQEGRPVVLWIDDWQTQLLNSSYKSILKDAKRLVRQPGAALQDSRYNIDWAREPKNLDGIMEGVRMLYEEEWPTVIAPFYTWGEHLRIFEKHKQVTESNLVTVDPSRYVDWYPIKPVPDEERKRQWVLGILSNQHEWLNEMGFDTTPLTEHEIEALETGDGGAIASQRWELWHAGGRAAKSEHRMKEADLVQKYAESWGVLSPPYWHAGSGWWRNRFVYTAYAGSVLAGSPAEAACLDPSYTYPAEMIEGFSSAQLRMLADTQKTALLKSMSTKEEVQFQLVETFRKAIG